MGMIKQHSLEDISEMQYLLENIKNEYVQGITPTLIKNNSKLFGNPHKIPKLKKIQINRGLGLAAQNTNILKKKHPRIQIYYRTIPIITRAKKSIAGFKVRED